MCGSCGFSCSLQRHKNSRTVWDTCAKVWLQHPLAPRSHLACWLRTCNSSSCSPKLSSYKSSNWWIPLFVGNVFIITHHGFASAWRSPNCWGLEYVAQSLIRQPCHASPGGTPGMALLTLLKWLPVPSTCLSCCPRTRDVAPTALSDYGCSLPGRWLSR